MVNNEIVITEHAEKRAKERCGWNKSATHRMAKRAYCSGLTHTETRGKLHRYLDKVFLQKQSANNLRVYGTNIFLFSGNTLLTIYNTPKDMLKGGKVTREK